MQFKFKGHIPSSKNNRGRGKGGWTYMPKEQKDFKASIKLQIDQNYHHLHQIVKYLPRPIHLSLDIVQWKNQLFDIDNKITTIQDVLFGCPTKRKRDPKPEDYGAFHFEDNHENIKICPGDVIIDKENLSSSEDDYFVISFIKKPKYELLDNF
jgi:hypothetical protein